MINQFALNPTNISISRSRFDRKSTHKLSFNAAGLIPVFLDEVLPGDTFEMKTSAVVRMSTPIAPVMDDAFLDVYYFFVPNRIIWNHWKQFNGENDVTFWTQNIEYTIPTVDLTNGTRHIGDLGDYFGIPINVNDDVDGDISISELPFRAYFMIWNEFFRDQNVQSPVLFSKEDVASDIATISAMPLPVNKYHDYFTSCLPQPQKGPSVELPLGDLAPVMTLQEDIIQSGSTLPAMRFDQDLVLGQDTILSAQGTDNSVVSIAGGGGASTTLGSPVNLAADLRNATASDINSLRMAFALQRVLEKDARGGTRYVEFLKNQFNVVSPDATQQRPEFLGGEKINVVVNQVLSTTPAQGDAAAGPLGQTGAYSLSSAKGVGFTKSFTEHGYVIGVACVRTRHTYGQGVDKLWTRKSRFDFYLPTLANIGEQPVNNYELVAVTNEGDLNTGVFGYQEAWAEYRYKRSYNSAYLNPNNPNALGYWNYGDVFSAADIETAPHLNSDFMKETVVNIDRTLSVQSSAMHQFVADFYFDLVCTRPMPLYSIPGLIDHN